MLSPAGIALIKDIEKCRLNAYLDPKTGGKPITIGWGSTTKKNGDLWIMGDTITQAEADDLFEYQLTNKYYKTLARTIPYWDEMSLNKQGALLSFAYNLGADFYGADGFDTISRTLKAKNWFSIPAVLLMYRNPGSNVEEGLRRRRIAEGELWKR